MPELSLEQIAQAVDGRLIGQPQGKVSGLAALHDAGPEQLSFLSNPRFRKQLDQCKAAAVLLSDADARDYAGVCIVVDDPYLAYAQVSSLFDSAPVPEPGISPAAHISEGVELGADVSIAPGVVIERGAVLGKGVAIGAGSFVGEYAEIGANSRIQANVSIYHRVQIGAQVHIHSGSVIGADGFGFAPGADGWQHIHQLGSVRIGDRVWIGACTSIDRGALGDTVIAEGVIIDNQVQIAHNVEIGPRTALAGCVGVAGSARIGADCTLGGGVGISGHLRLCDKVHVTGMTLVSKSINAPGVYSSGTALSSNAEWRKNAVRFLHLDKLFKRVAKLEAREQQE